MKEREVLACQIQEWYPRFPSVSIKTIIHHLPESFVSYLLQDGIFLPASSEVMPSRIHLTCPEPQAEDYHHWVEEDQQEDEPQVPSFPQLEDSVRASIQILGGAVFPKLNWSAPKDSAWISSSGSLKCRNFGEIALLLKASDSLVHDLSHAFDSCEDRTMDRPPMHVLALRKWCDLRPEMEFRGFVRGGLLVAICQREITSFYPALAGREDALESVVFHFFVEVLSDRFILEDYTFDCYVTKKFSIKLVDFNPWGAFTLPLLFSWDELEESYIRLTMLAGGLLEEVEEKDGGLKTGTRTVVDDLSFDLKVTHTLQGGGDEDVQEGKHSSSVNEAAHGDGMQGQPCGRRTEEDDSKQKLSYAHSSGSSGNSCQIGGDLVYPDSFGNSGRHIAETVTSKNMLRNTNDEERLHTRKTLNVQLREHGYRVQFRVVKSQGHVQPNLRMGGGVPYDYVNMGPGSAWEEFLRKASEELQQQTRDAAAGG